MRIFVYYRMKLKFFYTILIATVAIIGISSCAKKENYPITPAITFKQNILYIPGDSLDVQINFTDGDGDIGEPTGDTAAPYNCYLEYMVDTNNTGNFVTLESNVPLNPKATTQDTIAYPYTIPYITPTGNDKALNGIIQIRLHTGDWRFTTSPFANLGLRIKFKIWIIDRAGHISNRVLTDPILVPTT
jgi:hypothetical protein